MPDVAKRLAGPTQLGITIANVYGAVPAATTTIVRNIKVVNTTTSAVTVSVSVGTTGIDTDASRVLAASIPASTTYDWTGFMVIATGEFLTAKASVASSLTLTASGVEVS